MTYNKTQQEMINWFSEMYSNDVIIDGAVIGGMSNETLDMYYHVGRHVLDNPIEIDSIIYATIDKHAIKEKTPEQLKIEELEAKLNDILMNI